MLDLGSVKRQIDQMVVDQKQFQNNFLERVDLALREIRKWSSDWSGLSKHLESTRTSWLVARISGPPDATYPQPERPKRVTVIATDGSQIFPSRHEVSGCYLLNVGCAVIHYGTGERPALASHPTLCYREEDLYEDAEGRRSLVTRESVGLRRGAQEMRRLADLAVEAKEEGRSVVGLSDGTLILWALEGRPPNLRSATLGAYMDAFDRLRKAGVPFAGYISNPGSADVVNALRVGLCPEEPTNCDRCPWKADLRERLLEAGGTSSGTSGGLPCSPVEGVTDSVLFSRILEPGERSGVFWSRSRILDEYGPHRVCFFYLNAGAEISRVEMPAWVADEPDLLDLLHSCVVDQAQKGDGYPIVLSEAHQKAVVRGADRELFYRFLRDAMVRNDIRAEMSLKNLKKMASAI